MIDQIKAILKEKKKANGMNQEKLAKAIGRNSAHLSLILNGKIQPRHDIVMQIVEALDHNILLVRK